MLGLCPGGELHGSSKVLGPLDVISGPCGHSRSCRIARDASDSGSVGTFSSPPCLPLWRASTCDPGRIEHPYFRRRPIDAQHERCDLPACTPFLYSSAALRFLFATSRLSHDPRQSGSMSAVARCAPRASRNIEACRGTMTPPRSDTTLFGSRPLPERPPEPLVEPPRAC
jgi:hypothetical protein